ncbi:MAG: uroporphyrinogen decarboxylase family protein [Candidatus Brocadiia bacterium]|jgi:uroporphyrinogen-III decarboxylase
MSWEIPQISNAEKEAVWKAFNERKPIRVPVSISSNPRIVVLDPKLNRTGVTFEQIFNDPRVMMEAWIGHEHHRRMVINRYCDSPTGLPEQWTASVSWLNTHEAAFFGAAWHFREGQIPDTQPFLTAVNRESIFDVDIDRPIENPLSKRGLRFYEEMGKIAKDYVFHGRPVKVGRYEQAGTDGPLTTGMNLRGTDMMTDMAEDPEYAERLLDRLTDAAIKRVHAWRKYWNDESLGGGLADDSIQLISTPMYKRMVMPRHKRYLDEFAPDKPRGIHLCGDVMRHMKTLRDELNVQTWDSGFPVDFTRMRRELGPGVQINGGPGIMLLRHGTAQQVYDRTCEILDSGVKTGGRFVLTEANNLPPRVPEENLAAMYKAALDKGRYDAS